MTKFISLEFSGPASYRQQSDMKCISDKGLHYLCIKTLVDNFISQNNRGFQQNFMRALLTWYQCVPITTAGLILIDLVDMIAAVAGCFSALKSS